MATVTKDFRVKSGLVVEGTTGTIDGQNILTEGSTTFLDNKIQDVAGNLLENANLTNITVTYDDATNALSIEAAPTYSDVDARNALSGGAGIDYNSTTGEIKANIGNYIGAIETDSQGRLKVRVDDNTIDTAGSANYLRVNTGSTSPVASKTYAQDAADAAQTNAEGYADNAVSTHASDTSTHGVTGDIVGTSDTQTLTNKTLGSGTNANSDIDMNGNKITDLGTPSAGTDATNKTYVDGEVSTVDTAAQGYASSAETAAKSYADGIVSTAVTNLESYADTAATNAENNAKAYADGLSSGLTWKQAVNLLVTSNVNLGQDFVGVVIDGHPALDINDAGYRLLLIGQSTTAENGIYELVVDGTGLVLNRSADADTAEELKGAALFVQEGTQYGSTAWVQSNHYLTGFDGQSWSQFSGQGTYLAGNGLTLDGTTFEIDTAVTATKTYADGVGTSAVTTANSYTDVEIVTALTTAQGYATTAESNANQYTNQEISALNTNDIEEGTSNLYFTEGRVLDALANNEVTFTTINVNDVSLQVAATASVPTAGQVVAYAFNKSQYRSAEFLVKIAYSTHTELSKVVVTLDTSDNVAITEYAVVGTNGSLSAISAGVSGTNVQLLVTTGYNASTVTVVGTLLI